MKFSQSRLEFELGLSSLFSKSVTITPRTTHIRSTERVSVFLC